MPTISVFLDDEEESILEKRGKANLMTLKEQCEDILRRSCVRSKKGYTPQDPCDDALVRIFSKQNKGRKPKPKSKGEKQEQKVKSLLKKGKQQLINNKKADAKKTYTQIRLEFEKLENKDKKLFDEIMKFYGRLVR